jgi:uncharacterized protein YuzE
VQLVLKIVVVNRSQVERSGEIRTLRLTDEVTLNIGHGEQLVGIEVLDAKNILGKGQLPKVLIENMGYSIV